MITYNPSGDNINILKPTFEIVAAAYVDADTINALNTFAAPEPIVRAKGHITALPETLVILFPTLNYDLKNNKDDAQIYPSDLARVNPFHVEEIELTSELLPTPLAKTKKIIRDNMEAHWGVSGEAPSNIKEIEDRRDELLADFLSIYETESSREGMFTGMPNVFHGPSLKSYVIFDVGSGLYTVAYTGTSPKQIPFDNDCFFPPVGIPDEQRGYPIPPYPDPTNNRESRVDVIPVVVTTSIPPTSYKVKTQILTKLLRLLLGNRSPLLMQKR